MNWIDVNGTSLRYDLSGSGKSTLVLVHEMGGALESWDQVVPAVNNTRRVLRYDTRGAGFSEKIRTVTWDDMAADLAALLGALAIDGKVALAGIAVGAGIAAHFATRYPERTAALVLHGPATGITSADRRQATLQRAAAVEAGGMRGVVETSLAASYPPIVRHDAGVFSNFRARWLTNDPRSFAAINRMLAEHDITGDLARIACPTLVTAGTHDELRPPSLIEPMSRQIPGAQFLELNTGHFASMQTPGLVSQAIHAFLWSNGL